MEKESRKAPLKWMTLTMVIVLVASGYFAIQHILVRNEIHKVGRQSSELESDIASLRHDHRHAVMKWESMVDRETLKSRLSEHRSKLEPIRTSTLLTVPSRPLETPKNVTQP